MNIKMIILAMVIVLALSTTAMATDETDAIAIYHIEEGTGTNLDDAATADNDGTLGATGTWDATYSDQDWCVLLDMGATDKITIPHTTANSFAGHDFTVMMKITPLEDFDTVQGSDNRELAAKKDQVFHTDGWSFQINKGGDCGLILELGNGSAREMTYSDNFDWVVNTPIVVTASYNAATDTTTYYADKVDLNGAAYTLTGTFPTLDATDDITVAQGPSALDPTDAHFDWVLLFDTALTSVEVGDVIDSMEAGPAGPVISNTVPIQATSSYESDSKTFSLDISQTANVTWYLNTVLKETDTSVTSASYIDSTAAIGTAHNLTAIATNVNGSDSYEWDWDVLENTVDVEVTYYNPDNLSYNIIWDITNATAGLQSINVSYNNTANGNTYKGYIDLATDELLNTLVATGDGQTLWCNTTNVSDNTFFINETGGVETLFQYWDDGSWEDEPADYYIYHDNVFWWNNLHANLYQTASQPTLKITNTGSGSGIPYMWLDDEPPAEVKIWVDNDNIKNGDTIELGWGEANKTAVHTELAASESVEFWTWGGFFGYDGDFIFNVTAEVQ
jgi:hypothetical protein